MSDGQLVDRALLAKLRPPEGLNPERFLDLAGKARIEEFAAGQNIFKLGERDRKTCYLVDGELDLTDAKGAKLRLKSSSPYAREPLANHQPRQYQAVAAVDSRVVRFDSDLLDILLTWDQFTGIEVSELGASNQAQEDSDWMTKLLNSRAFLKLPPANMHALFLRIKELPVRTGEVIIRQGDDGDGYYIIKSGKAKVTRSSKTGSDLVLAQLRQGDGFGEEALLSDSKRNATVTMVRDGVLMFLKKEDFNELLKDSMVTGLSFEQAQEKARHGAVWLDVRSESEHKVDGLVGSVNIPLFMLRLRADSLDPTKAYLVYCDTGRRSSAAAFLLMQRGLTCFTLHEGLAGRG